MASTDNDSPEIGNGQFSIAAQDKGRAEFLALVAHLRPDLHRYCARMTGSVIDGEDVVQDTLARAYFELPDLQAVPPLRPWLFRIAHNRAIDHIRRESYRMSESLDEAMEMAADAADEPESILARKQAVKTAIGSFLALPPIPRACIILKDVLDHTLDEIVAELDISMTAVKAALHRGRKQLERKEAPVPPYEKTATGSPVLERYARLFNAHDWEGVRAMLADDVRLDLVSRRKATGRTDASRYFTNYGSITNWSLRVAWLDGKEVLAVLPSPASVKPLYIIILVIADDRVKEIRDFRYVPYLAQEMTLEFSPPDTSLH